MWKLWVDDVRPTPGSDWVWAKSVNEAKRLIVEYEQKANRFECLSLDHDAGDFAFDGGDYIKILDWLEETGRKYPIHIHSMNPVGVMNMRRIIQRNHW